MPRAFAAGVRDRMARRPQGRRAVPYARAAERALPEPPANPKHRRLMWEGWE